MKQCLCQLRLRNRATSEHKRKHNRCSEKRGANGKREKQTKKAGRCTPFAPHAFCGRQDVGRGTGIAVPTKQGARRVRRKQNQGGEEGTTKRTQKTMSVATQQTRAQETKTKEKAAQRTLMVSQPSHATMQVVLNWPDFNVALTLCLIERRQQIFPTFMAAKDQINPLSIDSASCLSTEAKV